MNIVESEYFHLVKKAQQEHYFTSIVTLPAPEDLDQAAQRSRHAVTMSEMKSLICMYEPTSLDKLINKGDQMNKARLSPRHVKPVISDNVRR